LPPTRRAYVLRVEVFGGPRAKSGVDRILATIRRHQTGVRCRRTPPSYVDVVTATEAP
jgi:hypothetical protein